MTETSPTGSRASRAIFSCRATAGAALSCALLAGCASNERVRTLETRVAKGEEARETLEGRVTRREEAASLDSATVVRWNEWWKERLAAIERREERIRLELARLERWQQKLAARETGGVGDKPAEPPVVDASKPADAKPADAKPADAKPADAKPADATNPAFSLYKTSAGDTWDPYERAVGKQLVELFSKRKAPDASFLNDNDRDGKPYRPRDPGKTGLDGETLVGKPLARTRFLASTGDSIDTADFKNKKNVVLVVLRGFEGSVCIACSGQTLAISQSLEEFEKRDAQVFLIYPGKSETIPKFLDAVRDLQGTSASLPVEVLLDVDLAIVKEFRIEGRLAKPTTVIVDKAGVVRFAHVGQSKSDRPSVPLLLDALDRIKGS